MIALACAALAFAGAARAAEIRSVALTPADDVSLPFWCDWGYDWAERCYRLEGARLGVGGGEPDKVWRSALRFSTSATPQWVVWDVTDLVGDWLSGGLQNNGVLVKLVDGEEDFAVSGPSFPSSRSASTASRPRLTVWYLP